MIRVFLGLGSNLVGRKDHLRATLDALSRSPRTELVGISRIYETRAVGVEEEQPDYLNCVAEVECDLPAVELLRLCQGIEVALGRDRKGERAPRTVDIDRCSTGKESSKDGTSGCRTAASRAPTTWSGWQTWTRACASRGWAPWRIFSRAATSTGSGSTRTARKPCR